MWPGTDYSSEFDTAVSRFAEVERFIVKARSAAAPGPRHGPIQAHTKYTGNVESLGYL